MKLKQWIGGVSIFLLLISSPSFLFPERQTPLFLLVLPVILIAQWVAWSKVAPTTPINLPLCLLFVMVAISVAFTPDLALSLSKISGILFGILIFLTVLRMSQSKNGWKLNILGFLVCGVGVALLGLVSTQWFQSKLVGLNAITEKLPVRLSGIPGAESGIHPNELAGSLLWLVIPSLFFLYEFIKQPGKIGFPTKGAFFKYAQIILGIIVFGFSTFVLVGVFILAQSRAAYVSVAFSLAFITVFIIPGKLRVVYGLFLGVLSVGAILWIRSLGWEKIIEITLGVLQVSNSFLNTDSLVDRVEIWSRAMFLIKDAPLTGIGMNAFRQVLHWVVPSPFISASFNLGHAHNEFLQVALDLGLPGLVAFLSIYWGALIMLIKTYHSSKDSRLFVLGLGGGLFSHFLFGFVDAVSLGSKPGFLFWWLLGLITSLYLETQQTVNNQSSGSQA